MIVRTLQLRSLLQSTPRTLSHLTVVAGISNPPSGSPNVSNVGITTRAWGGTLVLYAQACLSASTYSGLSQLSGGRPNVRLQSAIHESRAILDHLGTTYLPTDRPPQKNPARMSRPQNVHRGPTPASKTARHAIFLKWW